MSTTRLWKRIIARWICPTARFSSFRSSGIVAPCPGVSRGRSKPCPAGRAVGGAHLQVEAVAVELGRPGILRSGAVQGVEVERGRARRLDGRRRDVHVLHQDRLVEGQIVVDELPQVGEPGRYRSGGQVGDRHRFGDLAAVRLAELFAGALRPHPREAERRDRLLDRQRHRRRPTVEGLRQETLADDEVALRAMALHGLPPSKPAVGLRTDCAPGICRCQRNSRPCHRPPALMGELGF